MEETTGDTITLTPCYAAIYRRSMADIRVALAFGELDKDDIETIKHHLDIIDQIAPPAIQAMDAALEAKERRTQ